MQSAVMTLLKTETRKACEFSTYMKMLKSRPELVKYLAGPRFKENKLPVDQAQCDQLPGWACFSHEVFGFPPNICSKHLTGKYRFLIFSYPWFDILFEQALPRPGITMSNISMEYKPSRSTMSFTSRFSE